MPRLFTGIELPQMVRTRLSLLGAPIPGAKWVEADNLHITLRFFGDVDVRQADDLAAELAQLEAPRFAIRLSGLGSFGGREPRIIWAGVEAGPELEAVYRSHERVARRLGFEPEGRTFKPHVTLARCRGTRASDVAQFIQSIGLFTTDWFDVGRVVLYSSRSGRGGGQYVVEDAYPLA